MKRLLLLLIAGFAFGLAAPPAAAQDTRQNADFKLAIQLLDDGLYAQAEDQLRRFIERYPDASSAVEARFRLAELLQRTKHYSEARGLFQEFALNYPDNPKAPDAWWHLGEIFAAEHNYSEAGQAFAKLKSFHPKSAKAPEALLKASRYFLRADDYENARTVLNAVLLEYPASGVRFDARFALGRLYLAAGEYERALREFTRLLTEAVTAEMRPEVIVAIGETHAALGNRDEAERRYREVISTYPKSAAAQRAAVRLGDLHRNFRDFETAVENYESVASNDDATPDIRQLAFVGLAESAAAAGDHAAAVDAYSRLFRETAGAPVEPDVYRNAAAAARRAGQYTQAMSWLEELYTDTLVTTDRRALLVTMAETAREGDNYTVALARYREYLQRYPDDAGAPFAQLGIAEIEEREFRNYSSALEQYAAVNERYGITRVSDDAQFGRARTLETQGRSSDAAGAYFQLTVQYPASDLRAQAARRFRALMELSGGDALRAVEQLATVIAALQESPGSAEVDLLLGRVYLEDIRDFERAAQYYGKALEKGLAGEDAEEASWGQALAQVRRAQRGEGSVAEARARCNAFFTTYPASARRDDLAWALFRLVSDSGDAAVVMEAASDFLALNPAAHREEALIAYGFALHENGRHTEAEKEFTTVIETTDANDAATPAWYGRARARAAISRFDDALKDLSAYRTRAPNGQYAADALLLEGRTLARVGRYDEAARSLNSLVRNFEYASTADSARMILLGVLSEAGRHEDAVQFSRRFLDGVERNPFLGSDLTQEYLYAHAVTLALARERDAAKRALLRYTEEYPAGPHAGDVLYALGQMYRDEGKIDLATAYLQQAGNRQQGTVALRSAADLMLENGRYERAIETYEQLRERTTATIEQQYADSRIIIALYRQGRRDDARTRIDEFRSSWPDAKPVFDEFDLERGKYHFREGDYRTAEDIFEDVEDSDVRSIAALGKYWIGRCHEARSRNKDAREQYEDVAEDYPGSEAALQSMMALARMSMRAENYQEAAAQFKAVVDVGDIPEPMLKEAMNGLIRSYEELQSYDAALEMTKRFVETWPGDVTSFRKRVNLGTYYYQLAYFDQAIAHLSSLLSEAPPDDQAEIRYYIGEAYFSKGDFTQAALEFLKVPYLVMGKTEIDWTASAYYMAGQAYEKQSKFKLALDMYQKIIDTPGLDARFKAQAEKEIDRVRGLMN